MNRTGEKFVELMNIMSRLRSPQGCPWDHKQTPQTLKKYLLDEAHEVLEAVDGTDVAHVREELGDLLFIIVFFNQLYQEQGHFTMADVLDEVAAKMVRRHPHVFGDVEATTAADVRQNWIAIKAEENKDKIGTADAGPLGSVPRSLPALRRALKISERAAQAGFDWPAIEPVFDKLNEETAELRQALAERDREAIFEEVGDMLFALVNIGRMAGVNGEEALVAATDKFAARFNAMELAIRRDSLAMAELDDEALDRYWEQVKDEMAAAREGTGKPTDASA